MRGVTKYTGDNPFESVFLVKEFLSNYDHYAKYGFGRWAVIHKPYNTFLGWCGLKYTPELGETDIGFRFFKKYWNQGFATESAKACIERGFRKFGLKRMVGRAMKENVASIKVLGKTGLTYLKSFDFEGEEGVIYTIDAP